MAMFLVISSRSGPGYDPSKPLDQQSDWDAHAEFMNALEASGFVVIGGPLGVGERAALAVEAESEEAIRATLAPDPWSGTHLVIDTIEPWTILLDSRTA